MTYGEAHIAELDSMQLINGEFKKTLYIENKPEPMSRDDAVKYYNTKLYYYWREQLNEENPKRKKLNNMWVIIKMFCHPDNAKLLKEKKNVDTKR